MYLLDADVLIRAKNDHYGFDLCPGFWEWLSVGSTSGTVGSVEAVYNELVRGGDALADWARAQRAFFAPLTANEVAAVGAVNRWANDSPDYDPSAKAEFSAAADSILIAHAMAGSHAVVTHERISDGRRKIKIPNAALAHGVRFVDPFTMLREQRVQFVLS